MVPLPPSAQLLPPPILPTFLASSLSLVLSPKQVLPPTLSSLILSSSVTFLTSALEISQACRFSELYP